jgi:F-type H+-transporting ATPase subunit epsilon
MEAKENKSKIKITVVTPEGKIFEGDVDFISVPAKSGSMGILPRHVPIIAQLSIGILKLVSEGISVYLGVCRGYFELLDSRAYVLTERAILTDPDNKDAVIADLKKKHDITSEITQETKKVVEAIASLKTLRH